MLPMKSGAEGPVDLLVLVRNSNALSFFSHSTDRRWDDYSSVIISSSTFRLISLNLDFRPFFTFFTSQLVPPLTSPSWTSRYSFSLMTSLSFWNLLVTSFSLRPEEGRSPLQLRRRFCLVIPRNDKMGRFDEELLPLLVLIPPGTDPIKSRNILLQLLCYL